MFEQPPALPAGYVAFGLPPLPLLTSADDRWITLAKSGEIDEGSGVLVYEHRKTVIFFTADEAVSALSYLFTSLPFLVPQTTARAKAHLKFIRAIAIIRESRRRRRKTDQEKDKRDD